ncbi:hypothetical protein B0H63DRAFT_488394 [Podospora didyma]|uniref:Conidiation-specific protein 6 n=1 Tax=Podospora didyma TaxID=330526 RepID=A0AAE0N2E2_9PEZI|nr:hypothetical protein B0H63DRAFT_488394 [Podospora didyma]
MADMDDYDIPKEVPASADTERDPDSVVRGHKAAINNPNIFDKAKAHSRQVLETYGEPYEPSNPSQKTSSNADGKKDPGNVARGLKASISNPGVSDEAKQRAQEKLDAMQ